LLWRYQGKESVGEVVGGERTRKTSVFKSNRIKKLTKAVKNEEHRSENKRKNRGGEQGKGRTKKSQTKRPGGQYF